VARQFQGKKLGALIEEAAELLISVADVKDLPRLEEYVAREVDPVRGLLGFLVLLEKAGAKNAADPRAVPGKREVMARGTALVGQWMMARANAAAADLEQRMRGIPMRFFLLKRGKEQRKVEGRLTEATMEALRGINGLWGALEFLGADRVTRAVAALRGAGRTAPSWPPPTGHGDPSGGAVQNYVNLKAAMAANPDTFWLFGGALDDVAEATTARQDAEAYTIPITWGPSVT